MAILVGLRGGFKRDQIGGSRTLRNFERSPILSSRKPLVIHAGACSSYMAVPLQKLTIVLNEDCDHGLQLAVFRKLVKSYSLSIVTSLSQRFFPRCAPYGATKQPVDRAGDSKPCV